MENRSNCETQEWMNGPHEIFYGTRYANEWDDSDALNEFAGTKAPTSINSAKNENWLCYQLRGDD